MKAFIRVTPDNAAKYSTKVDREMQAMRGPLAGLPIAIKDNMVTEGVTTTCASQILHDYMPVYTATAVRQVWDDHVVMLGKTNLDEFAMGSSHRELVVPGHRATRGTSRPCPAARAAAPPPPSPPERRSGRSAATPAARSASRRRSAASSA